MYKLPLSCYSVMYILNTQNKCFPFSCTNVSNFICSFLMYNNYVNLFNKFFRWIRYVIDLTTLHFVIKNVKQKCTLYMYIYTLHFKSVIKMLSFLITFVMTQKCQAKMYIVYVHFFITFIMCDTYVTSFWNNCLQYENVVYLSTLYMCFEKLHY